MGGDDPISRAAKEAEKAVSSAGKALESGVQQVGKNIEKSVSGVLQETAYALGTGNFNNFDQTLLNMGVVATTGGILGPQATQLKETNVQRATREAQEEAALQEMQANAAKEQERLAGLANMLTASAAARRLAPGMSQTLLGSAPSRQLLTVKS